MRFRDAFLVERGDDPRYAHSALCAFAYFVGSDGTVVQTPTHGRLDVAFPWIEVEPDIDTWAEVLVMAAALERGGERDESLRIDEAHVIELPCGTYLSRTAKQTGPRRVDTEEDAMRIVDAESPYGVKHFLRINGRRPGEMFFVPEGAGRIVRSSGQLAMGLIEPNVFWFRAMGVPATVWERLLAGV